MARPLSGTGPGVGDAAAGYYALGPLGCYPFCACATVRDTGSLETSVVRVVAASPIRMTVGSIGTTKYKYSVIAFIASSFAYGAKIAHPLAGAL